MAVLLGAFFSPVLFQDEKTHRAFALRWVGSEPGAAAYLASLAVDRASNREEFLKANPRHPRAATAELVIAECQYRAGQFEEAQGSYAAFVKRQGEPHVSE